MIRRVSATDADRARFLSSVSRTRKVRLVNCPFRNAHARTYDEWQRMEIEVDDV